jgi:hypothetical protein
MYYRMRIASKTNPLTYVRDNTKGEVYGIVIIKSR